MRALNSHACASLLVLKDSIALLEENCCKDCMDHFWKDTNENMGWQFVGLACLMSPVLQFSFRFAVVGKVGSS